MSVSFKDNRVAFEYQCKHGIVELKPLQGVVALVLDARAEFGEAPVEVGENGQQLVMVRVASRDGGFVVPARTPSGGGERLAPGDLVIWSPLAQDAQRRNSFGDARCSWVGFVRAKIANELPFRFVCRYD